MGLGFGVSFVFLFCSGWIRGRRATCSQIFDLIIVIYPSLNVAADLQSSFLDPNIVNVDEILESLV